LIAPLQFHLPTLCRIEESTRELEPILYNEDPFQSTINSIDTFVTDGFDTSTIILITGIVIIIKINRRDKNKSKDNTIQ
jgi:hypothetical protein